MPPDDSPSSHLLAALLDVLARTLDGADRDELLGQVCALAALAGWTRAEVHTDERAVSDLTSCTLKADGVRLGVMTAGSDGAPSLPLETIGRVAALVLLLERLRDHTAQRDPLTGLLNQQAVEAALRREVERGYRFGHPVSVLVLNVDRLGAVNSLHGRAAGDACVQAVAEALQRVLRQIDLAARPGSDDFIVVLPGAELDAASEVAERLRCAVASAPLPVSGALTSTIGVATLGEHAANAAALLQAASAAMATGKRRGRNCVTRALPLRT